VLDEPRDLPEGTGVAIAVLDDEGLTPEERAELEPSIDRSIDQADRGEGRPIEEVLGRLRAM
jgi:hypothetical protein